MSENCCNFIDSYGRACKEKALSHGLCFWHDPRIDKSGIDIKRRLENYVRSGGVTQGLQLQYTRLEGVDLVHRGHHDGFDLSGSDFYRANLADAHLFKVKLCNGSIMKANMEGTNLHCCDLTNCNLLGSGIKTARLVNANIGDQLLQETEGRQLAKQGNKEDAIEQFQQAEEIYRNIRKGAENQGLFELAGHCFRRELIMRRYQLPKPSSQRMFHKIVDLFCGYGEKPMRVVLFSMLLIITCALLYFNFGIHFDGSTIHYAASAPLVENVRHFLSCIYFSVVTFTTLGYGDLAPAGAISRFVAAFEAFMGSFTMALFVVVFVKKMTR